jgi:hypothetical protein
MNPETPFPSAGPEGPLYKDLTFRMERVYYIGTFFLIFLFIGLLTVGYFPLVYSLLAFGTVLAPLQRAVMYMSATYFFILLISRFMRKEMDRVRYTLTDRSIIQESPFSITEIPFADIQTCAIRSFPLVKGYVRITAAGRRILLPSTIHRFSDLVEELALRLSSCGRSDLCGTQNSNALRRIACIAEFSHARSRAAFFPLIYGTILTVAANAFIAGALWGASAINQVIWMGGTMTAPLLVYGLADFRLNRTIERQLLRDPAALPRLSLRDELILSSLVITGVLAVAGILFKAYFFG